MYLFLEKLKFFCNIWKLVENKNIINIVLVPYNVVFRNNETE